MIGKSWQAPLRNKIKQALDQDYPPHRIALSFSTGVVMGFTPWPAHTAMAVALAALFRLPLLPAAVGVWVNALPIMPFTYGLAFFIGEWATGVAIPELDWERLSEWSYMWPIFKGFAWPMIVGCFFLGAPLAVIFYFPVKSLAEKLARRRKTLGRR